MAANRWSSNSSPAFLAELLCGPFLDLRCRAGQAATERMKSAGQASFSVFEGPGLGFQFENTFATRMFLMKCWRICTARISTLLGETNGDQ